MKHILINCAAAEDAAALHRMIAQALDFPAWYGGNLDALYDCLTELETPVELTLQNLPAHGEFGAAFRAALEDAAEENPVLKLEFI